MKQFGEQASASEVMEEYMKRFGTYTLSRIPNSIDGLKPVQRYIILALGTNQDFVKVQNCVGRVIEKHPHSDQSIEDAIAHLGQPWNNALPLVELQGNVGMYCGERAASGRYLEVTSAEFTRDVYFHGVNPKTFELVPSELGNSVEPKHLIPRIPMILLTGAFALTVGYNTSFVPLNLISLCKLTAAYIELRKTFSAETAKKKLREAHPEWLIPDFFFPCSIRNTKELLKAYAEGNFEEKVLVDGKLTMTPTAITLNTLPPNVSIGPTWEKAAKSVYDKNHDLNKWIAATRNISSGRDTSREGDVTYDKIEAAYPFELRRGVNPFHVLDKFKQVVSFTRGWKPNMLWWDDTSGITPINPMDVLEIWYMARRRSVLGDLRYQQNKLVAERHQLKALLVVADHPKDISDLFRKAKDRDDVILQLRKKYQLSITQSNFLCELSLSQLTKAGRDELVERLAKNKEAQEAILAKFQRIDDQMIEDQEYIAHKYRKVAVRKAKTPDYVCCLKCNGGIIQYWDEEELHEAGADWGYENVDIVLYPSGQYYVYVKKGDQILSSERVQLPRELSCDDIYVSKRVLRNTIILYNDGKLFRCNGLVASTNKDAKSIPVGQNILTVKRDGTAKTIPTTAITLRKSINSQGVNSDYYYVGDAVDDDIMVAHANTREPNVIRVTRLVNGNGSIQNVPYGTWTILGVFRRCDRFAVALPDKCLRRSKNRHLVVPANYEIREGRTIRIHLSQKKVLNAPGKVVRVHGSHMFTIKR